MRKLFYKILPVVLFAAMALYILLGFYRELVYAIHLRTPYIADSLFCANLLKEPFGLMRLVGCWLAQFCYYPLAGVAVFVVLWIASYFVSAKAFNIDSRLYSLHVLPLACLLLGVTGVGYWVYILKDFGYFFSQPLAFLLMLVALALTQSIAAKTKYPFAIALPVCIVLYPVIGWYALLMALCLFITELPRCGAKSAVVLLAFASPLIYKVFFYSACSYETLLRAGFPLFDDQSKFYMRWSAPFIVLAVAVAAVAVVSVFCAKNKAEAVSGKLSIVQKPVATYVFIVAMAGAMFGGVWHFMFKDYNYLAEMRMTRAALNDDWATVLANAERSTNPSRTMVLLKNIALMNMGELGERSFELSNDGRDVTNVDGFAISSMYMVAPLVYYNYGKMHHAVRWATENAVVYGFSPFQLMWLSRASLAIGENRAAHKYTNILRQNAFYSNWRPKEKSMLVDEIQGAYADLLDSDNNNVERYLIEIFSKSAESNWAAVKELALFYSLLYGGAEEFWPAFVGYVQMNPAGMLPRHYQEAYCLFMEEHPVDQLPVKPRISETILQEYIAFRKQYVTLQKAGIDAVTMRNSMKAKWGGTFWWHNYFGRNRY